MGKKIGMFHEKTILGMTECIRLSAGFSMRSFFLSLESFLQKPSEVRFIENQTSGFLTLRTPKKVLF
jgi:hypothetical protein